MQKNPENYLNSLSLAVIKTDRNDKKLAEREACVIILQLLLITALNKLLGLFNSYSRMSGKLCLYPGGCSWEFLVGVSRPVLQILALFQTKNVISHPPFSDQTSKIHIRFQTWPLGRNYIINTWIRAQTKKLFKCIWNWYISISFLFICNWNDKYVHKDATERTLGFVKVKLINCKRGGKVRNEIR